MRAGLLWLRREDREAQIARGVPRLHHHPQEDWVGEAGLRLGAALLAGQELAGGEPDTTHVPR